MFQFMIFKDKIKKKKNRLSVETDIMHIVKEFYNSIMNKIIPNKYNVKTISFLK